MASTYDVAIVGSGFAGSILARILHHRRKRVLLLEKGRHPRFAIGESTTPLANFALERLAVRYNLPDLWQLSTHGRWLRYRSGLRRGLKRGFTFYRHRHGEPFHNSAGNENRLLVAASPSDAIADTHWMRADVDAHMVRQAALEGVTVFDETEVDGVEITDKGVVLSARSEGERLFFNAEQVVDATGPAAAVARALGIGDGPQRVESSLLFTHLEGHGDFVELARRGGAQLDDGPYPDERAAVHHLIDEGWVYVLPFDHTASSPLDPRGGTVASVGIVLTSDAERRAAAVDAELTWRDVLGRYPTLAEQLLPARHLRPVTFVERQQHRLHRPIGERLFVLPHAFSFVDPMFSTGMAWSLLGVERLADLLLEREAELTEHDYGALLTAEAERISDLIEAAYKTRHDFAAFTAICHLYFATVSFFEARQRLLPEDVVPPAWEGFLGVGDAHLNEVFANALELVRNGHLDVLPTILEESLASRNVAGLFDPARRNLYGVDLDVLVERASLLGLERHEVEAALPRLRGDVEPPIEMTPGISWT